MIIAILSKNIIHHYFFKEPRRCIKKSNNFEGWVSLLFFVLNDKKLSSNIDKISEHINSSNKTIHPYDHMSKIIVNLCIKIRKQQRLLFLTNPFTELVNNEYH